MRMIHANDSAAYRDRLALKLQPDTIRSTLAFAGLFQVAHEMVKGAVLDQVRDFYCLGLNADGSMTDRKNEAYQRHVLSLASDRFRASLLWLVQHNAITQPYSPLTHGQRRRDQRPDVALAASADGARTGALTDLPRGNRTGLHGVDHLLAGHPGARSEEHTSELQSRGHLVCRLLLERKKIDRLDDRQGQIVHT